MVLVDANVLLDVWHADPVWCGWSKHQLGAHSQIHQLAINALIYAEVSVSFETPRELDEELAALSIEVLEIPREAAFLAGRAHAQYRRRGGPRANILSDFFLGAHAAVLGCAVLSRDTRRYSTYFPRVELIAP